MRYLRGRLHLRFWKKIKTSSKKMFFNPIGLIVPKTKDFSTFLRWVYFWASGILHDSLLLIAYENRTKPIYIEDSAISSHITVFLIACTRLFTSLCRSILPSEIISPTWFNLLLPNSTRRFVYRLDCMGYLLTRLAN